MKITILDSYAQNPGDLSWDELAQLGELTIYDRTPKELVAERAKDSEIVLTNKVRITKELLDQLPALQYIGVQATGYDIIDIAAAKERGIVVTNIPSYSTASVAQMVFAHILNITNNVGHYANHAMYERWSNNPDFCFWDSTLTELAGKQIGIVGLGNTGSATARIALAFGMKVVAYTSKSELPDGIRKVALEELFSTSDIVSLHCPLNEDTRHMVNSNVLKTMKPSAFIVNTGRGPLVADNDVAEALKNKTIAAYAADVLTTEPPQRDNPLLTAPNCFITPHIAWATLEARQRLMKISINNIKAFIEGNPINVINK